MMLVVVLSLLLAQASDAPTPPILAPDGAWVAATPPGANERLFWRDNSTSSILELYVFPATDTSSEEAAKAIENDQLAKSGGVPLSDGPFLTNCSHNAYRISFQGSVGGTSFTSNLVVLSTPAAVYVVAYQRPTSLSDDLAALATQASLCPKEDEVSPTPQPTPSPTPQQSALPLSAYNFIKPPANWRFAPFGGIATWKKDSEGNERFIVGAGMGSTQSSKQRALAAFNAQKGALNSTYITGVTKQLCGYQAFETWVTWKSGSGQWIAIGMHVATPTRSYAASYARLANLPEDPAAMAALDSLCPPKK